MKNYPPRKGNSFICDVCGFRRNIKFAKLRWDGLLCCFEDWELRQPQDTPVIPRVERFPNPNNMRSEPPMKFVTDVYPNGVSGTDL